MYNSNGQYSIVFRVLVGANYRYRVVDIGTCGRNTDGGVVTDSALEKVLGIGSLNMTRNTRVGRKMTPYVTVADEAFPVKENIIRPYSGRGVTSDQKIVNYRLLRARRVVGNAFEILSHRKLFYRKINLAPKYVDCVGEVAIVLHNSLRSTSDFGII